MGLDWHEYQHRHLMAINSHQYLSVIAKNGIFPLLRLSFYKLGYSFNGVEDISVFFGLSFWLDQRDIVSIVNAVFVRPHLCPPSAYCHVTRINSAKCTV